MLTTTNDSNILVYLKNNFFSTHERLLTLKKAFIVFRERFDNFVKSICWKLTWFDKSYVSFGNIRCTFKHAIVQCSKSWKEVENNFPD